MGHLALPRYIFIVGVVLLTTAAGADEVVVNNGDRLRGEVVSMAENQLVLKTSYAGNVTINWGEVRRISIERPFEVTLRDENTVKSESISSPADRVAAVKPDQGSPPAIHPLDGITKLEPVTEKGWEFKGRFTLGLNIESGNTVKQNFHFDGDSEIAKLPHRIKLFAESTVESNDHVRTDDNQFFHAAYNYFLTPQWFALTDGQFQRDKFADLTAFGIFTAGAGYQFWRSAEKNLSVSLAPGYAIQRFSTGQSFLDGDSEREFPALVWSLDFDIWLFKKTVQFFHYDSLLFNLEDSEGWNVITRTGFRIPLFWKLFANLQYNFKYANQPADGKVSDDGTFVTGLGLKW